ncbi:MAG: hypothetical protein WKF61_00675 [Luteimonas sp.]
MQQVNETIARKVLKPYERHSHTTGRKRTPTYLCWRNMISRCTNANRPDFSAYGGRGNSVSHIPACRAAFGAAGTSKKH